MTERIVYVVLFEPLDPDLAAVGGFDWYDTLRDAQKSWRNHEADNDMVNPTHRVRLFEFQVNSLSTPEEVTDACNLEFFVDDTRLAPLRDSYKVIPNEQLVATIYNLPGNEGAAYTIRFPKGNEFSIGDAQDQYGVLASILDEEYLDVEPVQFDKAVLDTMARGIDAALVDIRAGKGDPLASLEAIATNIRVLGALQ